MKIVPSMSACVLCRTSSVLTLMCFDDLWQWLSETLEAHPILGSRFSFRVTSGTFDGFLLSAGMFHNCQNFDWSGISEKKNYQRVKKKASCTTFPHVSAQNCSGWGSQSHHLASLWLADLANWSPHSFIVLCPCLLGLVFCIFGPFLDHIIKALESSTLRPGRVIHSCNPTIWEVLAGIWGHHFWATWNLVTKQHQ